MVELKLSVKKQNIQVFKDVHDKSACREIALKNKDKAFSVLSNVKTLFNKNDVPDIIHEEQRFEPFWYIRAEGYTEYLKERTYDIHVDPQVRDITINGKTFYTTAEAPICVVPATDHCVEENVKRLIVSADERSNHPEKFLKEYLKFDSKVIKETEALMGPNRVVVPATVRASYLIRDLFKDLIKPVHADKIIDENISVTDMILFFRPIYAFELKNNRGETGTVEVDACTGEAKKGKVYKKEFAELVNEATLFELGAEIASEILPGVGLGTFIGKKVHEHHKKKQKLKMMEKSKAAMAKHRK